MKLFSHSAIRFLKNLYEQGGTIPRTVSHIVVSSIHSQLCSLQTSVCLYLTSPGEELGVTARREVVEETGIDSEFLGVLCMRHLHGFRYNCSDFYYVCLMKALTHDIKICDQELVDCQWMDVSTWIS